ncbi:MULTISPECIES: LysR family transcriptional regulator [Mesorhizobium]|uniref:LysR family transcriptional regulator n=1 Tax=Mesorhizobium denitrificans TaxID=2294114 RepID=A0A371XH07_9HYPH|nr:MULTISPECIES: LysR family transcriptional regulator [Mesorhizobium]RFC68473.1 LysR family transcriptional regulator [Mesorhizobium denitrificans]
MDHSSKNLPPLESLRAFEAAARLGSFSSAAEQLHLTHGAVSRQVSKLEQWLGFKVFERKARGVQLTLEGNRLFIRTSEAFALIADNTDRWSEPRGSTIVRLATIPSVAGLWLIPRLHALEAGPPRLRIILNVDIHQNDLTEEAIDLSVRCGRGGIAGRVSVKLFEEKCFPIASPELAREIGADGNAKRTLDYPLIHDSDASAWRAWLGAHGLDYVPRAQDRRFEDYNLVLDAAANGLGIALARPPLALAQIESGRLACVDSRSVANPVSYWMDRPIGPVRPAAETLAQRIAQAAELDRSKLQAFLRDPI